MIITKTNIIVFLVGIFLGLCTGFFTGKAIYDKPLDVGTETDTVIIHDTIPDYNPTPKDSVRLKWVTRWLPTKPDTVEHFIAVNNMIHDTVAVEVPITSKHYGAPEYDAWVSGFEPSLDSIKVYRRTEYITERITISKPPDKWELDIVGGIDYNTAQEKYTPYAVGELLYKPNRLQLGIQGGIIKADKVEPIVGVKAKIMVF